MIALWMVVTIALYAGARALQTAFKGNSFLNTVLLPAGALLLVFQAAPGSIATYRSTGSILLWFLGPATVALAIPLYTHLRRVRVALKAAIVSLLVGSVVSAMAAIGIASVLSAQAVTIRSLAPKSVTTPIAMAIAESIGGASSLAAVFVIVTGSVGALTGSVLFDIARVRDSRARGFALGVAAHGMGTARAFQIDATAGIFATVGMTVNGVVTALLLPTLWRMFA